MLKVHAAGDGVRSFVPRGVVLQLEGVGIQDVVGREGLVTKRGVGASVLHDVHQRENAALGAAVVAVGGEAHLELVGQLVAHAGVPFANHGVDVVVDDVVGVLKVHGVLGAVAVAGNHAGVGGQHVAARAQVVVADGRLVVVVDVEVQLGQGFVGVGLQVVTVDAAGFVAVLVFQERRQGQHLRAVHAGDVGIAGVRIHVFGREQGSGV